MGHRIGSSRSDEELKELTCKMEELGFTLDTNRNGRKTFVHTLTGQRIRTKNVPKYLNSLL